MLCLENVHSVPTQGWLTCSDVEGGTKRGEVGGSGVISVHAANRYHHAPTKRIDESSVRKSSVASATAEADLLAGDRPAI
ncbi:hypothetical protein [Streptosporangium carneum]|uniref:Uncharacterized protein n=1 Tax=Streptosporangium carneum TaxID=47481 RepID=A0A9W6HUV0_9ACTN|nr:hypothetical protein [Streptosporangium carneum]GLK06752.1 hypothetical protein GCM10017600_01570 [Streptosporangium carneum]